MSISIDAVVKTGCPSTSHAINASTSVDLCTGHAASTLGFVNSHSRFWSGILAGRMGMNLTISGNIYSPLKNVPFNSDEYLFEGVSQIEGMSGGATINGNGYTGCVHGTNMDPSAGQSRNYRVNMAAVIPARRLSLIHI